VAFWHLGVPGLLESTFEAVMVQGKDLLPLVAPLVVALDGERWAARARKVRDKALADAVPAGLLTLPGKAAAGPGQLLTVEQATAGALDLVEEATARGS